MNETNTEVQVYQQKEEVPKTIIKYKAKTQYERLVIQLDEYRRLLIKWDGRSNIPSYLTKEYHYLGVEKIYEEIIEKFTQAKLELIIGESKTDRRKGSELL